MRPYFWCARQQNRLYLAAGKMQDARIASCVWAGLGCLCVVLNYADHLYSVVAWCLGVWSLTRERERCVAVLVLPQNCISIVYGMLCVGVVVRFVVRILSNWDDNAGYGLGQECTKRASRYGGGDYGGESIFRSVVVFWVWNVYDAAHVAAIIMLMVCTDWKERGRERIDNYKWCGWMLRLICVAGRVLLLYNTERKRETE